MCVNVLNPLAAENFLRWQINTAPAVSKYPTPLRSTIRFEALYPESVRQIFSDNAGISFESSLPLIVRVTSFLASEIFSVEVAMEKNFILK
jgi:hypothetical protein